MWLLFEDVIWDASCVGVTSHVENESGTTASAASNEAVAKSAKGNTFWTNNIYNIYIYISHEYRPYPITDDEPFYGIYVGNIPWDTTSAALRPLLSIYGEIHGEIFIRRGCAFLKYKTKESFEGILAAFSKDETQVCLLLSVESYVRGMLSAFDALANIRKLV